MQNAILLKPNDFVMNNGNIIFSSQEFNGLFRADIADGKSHLIDFFPEEDLCAEDLFLNMHRYNNFILFVPARGKNFVVYDCVNEKFQIILSGRESRIGGYKYYASVLVEKYVYVFGFLLPEIIRIDMESMKVKYYDGWLEELYKYGQADRCGFFYKDVCRVENSLFGITAQNNTIIELDMKSDKIYFHPIGREKCIFKSLAWNQGFFWLLDQSQGVLRVRKDNWDWCYLQEGNDTLDFWFPYSSVINSEVWVFSNLCGSIVKINCIDLSISKTDKKEFGYYYTKAVHNGSTLLLCQTNYEMQIFEPEKAIRQLRFYWENPIESYHREHIRYQTESGKAAASKLPFGNLQAFISLSGAYNNEKRNEKGYEAGKRIYEHINNDLSGV